MKLYFSDIFEIDPKTIEEYGAFNMCLITDLPLFIDPFLLFYSKKPEYQELHKGIIEYLKFLRNKSISQVIDDGLLNAWFMFPEIKQNWFGYCTSGNSGHGLGRDFALALNRNLNTHFRDFGTERITKSSHLEKLCLIKGGVGKDNMSDFATNLLHEFLLDFTQTFALENIDKKHIKKVPVNKVRFNYYTETWETDYFYLPYYRNDYVLLTPSDILTKDETFINRDDFLGRLEFVPNSIEDETLRAQVNNYLFTELNKDDKKKPTKEERYKVYEEIVSRYPQIIDYYLREKELDGEYASTISSEKVHFSQELYVEQFSQIVRMLKENTDFYSILGSSYDEAYARVIFLKNIIENNDGYKIFYIKGKPIKREEDLQILYRLTWFAPISDINREVNNGRGPVDFKASRGDADKTLVEFKLASNSQLKRNLQNQVKIYEMANGKCNSIKAILYFSEVEYNKVIEICNELALNIDKGVILIDARDDNKLLASKA